MMKFLSLRIFYFSLMNFSGPSVMLRIKAQVRNVLSLKTLKLHPVASITSNIKYVIFIFNQESAIIS